MTGALLHLSRDRGGISVGSLRGHCLGLGYGEKFDQPDVVRTSPPLHPTYIPRSGALRFRAAHVSSLLTEMAM